MWNNLKMTGSRETGLSMQLMAESAWLTRSTTTGSLLCVTDGSYMRDLHTEVCTTAIILECQQGYGCLSLSFSQINRQANAYRSELLGLMAVHLLLLGIQEAQPDLQGNVLIYSDCQGSLSRI